VLVREGRRYRAPASPPEFVADTILDHASPGGEVQPQFRRAGAAAHEERRVGAMTETTMEGERGAASRALRGLGRFLLRTKALLGPHRPGRRRQSSARRSTRTGSTSSSAPGNLSNVLRQVSNNGIVAVGMTLVILTAGIDLSVARPWRWAPCCAPCC